MSVSQVDVGYCEDCDTPDGGYVCRACAKEGYELGMRKVLERMKTVTPGLTHAEILLLERFIDSVEAL